MNEKSLNQPHFLGIGAARSGTTWIDKQLRRSPSIWMPRRKELHYFTRDLKYPSSSHLADAKLLKRLFSFSDHNTRFKQELIKAFGRDLIYFDLEQFRWDWKFFLSTYSDAWYQSLFSHKSDFVTGEITPAYSLLDDTDLENLRRLLPKVKLIFIMRNPIDRAWSTIRYHEKRENKKLTQMTEDEVTRYLNRDAITSRSNYIEIIDRWLKYYPPEQLFLCYYDEIMDTPADLLNRLCEFLEIESIPLSARDMSRRINESFESEMPSSVRKSLYSSYRDQITQLSSRFCSYATKWLEQIDSA